jgi:DNA repair exonuclease SbcCD ATPase subunit
MDLKSLNKATFVYTVRAVDKQINEQMQHSMQQLLRLNSANKEGEASTELDHGLGAAQPAVLPPSIEFGSCKAERFSSYATWKAPFTRKLLVRDAFDTYMPKGLKETLSKRTVGGKVCPLPTSLEELFQALIQYHQQLCDSSQASELQTLDVILVQLQSEVNELQSTHSSAKQALQEVQSRAAGHMHQLQLCNKTITALRSELDAGVYALQQLQQQKSTLRQKYKTTASRRIALRARLRQLGGDCAALSRLRQPKCLKSLLEHGSLPEHQEKPQTANSHTPVRHIGDKDHVHRPGLNQELVSSHKAIKISECSRDQVSAKSVSWGAQLTRPESKERCQPTNPNSCGFPLSPVAASAVSVQNIFEYDSDNNLSNAPGSAVLMTRVLDDSPRAIVIASVNCKLSQPCGDELVTVTALDF